MPHRVLIVADQTLGGEELAAAVRDRVLAGATELWIVVPATKRRDLFGTFVAAGPGLIVPIPDGSTSAAAFDRTEQRLQEARRRLAHLDIPVGGEVVDDDPFHAVRDVLSRREFDEVIVSTLPTGLSHWLHADLPGRVHRKFDIPVTTITARAKQRA